METIVKNPGCKFPGCNKKHHGKGYCKTHYGKFNIAPNANPCSFPGCNSEIGIGAKGFCPMHYTRQRRNGDPAVVIKNRKYKSFINDIRNSTNDDSYLDFVIADRVHWARICKEHYGDYCHICGWDETSCDVDHIIDRSKGGENTIRNGIVLCPNHHAMKHRKRKQIPLEVQYDKLPYPWLY